jgi:hypothetical protein
VRRNILTYLEQHHKMPPAAVVLTAVLHSTVPVDCEADALMLEGSLPELLPSSNGSSSSSAAADAGSSDAAAGAAAAAVADAYSSNSSSSSSSQWSWWGQQPSNDGNSSRETLGSDSSSSGEVTPSFSGSSESIPVQGPSSSSRGNSSSSSSEGISSLVGTVVQQLATGLGLQHHQQQQTRVVQQLVGVAEVSFNESTRSSYLTLNPPKVGTQKHDRHMQVNSV